MSRCRRAACILVVTSAVAAAADASLWNLVMPNARMVSGINVERIKNSPLLQSVASQMQSSDAEFQKFIIETGFDPRRDLHEILIAAPATGSKSVEALILIRGSFDPLKAMALARKHGATLQQYKGVTVLAGKPKGALRMGPATRQPATIWFTFLSGSVAAFGDAASVRGAIDRRGVPAKLDPRLVARAHELSSRYDVWGVSTAPPVQFSSKVPDERLSGAMQGDVLRGVTETSGGIRIGADIEIFGEAVTRSEKDAAALAGVIRFFAGMLQLNQKDAKITAPAKILQSMNLTTQGNVMQLSMKIPQADVEKMINDIKRRAELARAKVQSPAASPVLKQAPPTNPGTITVHSSEMGTVRIETQP